MRTHSFDRTALRQFGIWGRVKPPFSRPVLALARGLMPLLPRGTGRGVRVRRLRIAGRKCFLLEERRGEKAACLVYFHGGAFAFRAAPYHFANAADYVRGTGCKVLLPDYALAPVHPWPAANEDCLAAYRYAVEHAEVLGIDPSRIAVGGDSAGGFLAADVALRAAERGLPPPMFAMLLYPVLGGEETPSMRAYPDTPMWNAVLNRRMWHYFAPNGCPVPVQFPLHGFPPCYVETAQYDCLHDEGEDFARRLAAAGVPVTYADRTGTMHGFDIARRSVPAREAMAQRIAALREAFSQPK